MTTWATSLRLSNSLKNWLATRSETPPSLTIPRFGIRASISSKNRMHGADCFAFLKISWSVFSDSPSHFEKRMGPLMEMKFKPVSPARAFAMRVFPVPDGPLKRMPLGGANLPAAKSSGYLYGQSTIETSVSLIFSSPPTCSHRTADRSVKNSRVAEGSISRSAVKKSSLVICKFSVSARIESTLSFP